MNLNIINATDEAGIAAGFGGLTGGADVGDKITAYVNIAIGLLAFFALLVAGLKTAMAGVHLRNDPETDSAPFSKAFKKVYPGGVGVFFAFGTLVIGSIAFAIMKTFFGSSGGNNSTALATGFGKLDGNEKIDSNLTNQISGGFNVAIIGITLLAYGNAILQTAMAGVKIPDKTNLEHEDAFKIALKSVSKHGIGFGFALGAFFFIGIGVGLLNLFWK